KEIWRSIAAATEPGYCQPILINAPGARQLVIWHPTGLFALDAPTGKLLWQEPFKIQAGLTVATPVQSGLRLFVSAFYNGPMMMELDRERPAARLVWKGRSSSEIDTDGLHSLISTPVLDGDYIYGVCSYGQLRCLDARTGARVWETLAVT